jgi:hypothetical protein
MPLTEGTVKRAVVASGDNFKIFDNGDGFIQAVAPVDVNGDPIGIVTNPLPVTLKTITTNYVSGSSAVYSAVISNAACILREIEVVLSETATTQDLCLMIFNSTTVPADATAPFRRYRVPARGMMSKVFPTGLVLSTGCSVALSTTFDSKTIASGNNSGWFQALTG